MKLELFSAEANNIWEKAASKSDPTQLQLELDLYKKLLSFFQVGDYYYLFFNLTIMDLELVSQEIKNVLGYHPSEFSLNTFLDKVHPDDRPWLLNYENKAAEFLAALSVDKLMKYKVRYDFRIQKINGEYIRVLHQSMIIDHDSNGQLLRTFVVQTDISHLKATGRPLLSIIGLEGEPSYLNIDVEKKFAVSKEVLSKREKEILILITEGKLSKDIGEILHISKLTVDTHRNNMMSRNNLKNTSELVAKAIRQGWI